ncbi:hypothetical protein [Flavisolibacter nicotianae]|uniref:hypothetical protein n=1 Tax=Flavisolibacter nicotianae TaxID=2364882 RepID=UPI000EB254DA|nr:hypothetical protein [Flavisolibacter nicotianae]
MAEQFQILSKEFYLLQPKPVPLPKINSCPFIFCLLKDFADQLIEQQMSTGTLFNYSTAVTGNAFSISIRIPDLSDPDEQLG